MEHKKEDTENDQPQKEILFSKLYEGNIPTIEDGPKAGHVFAFAVVEYRPQCGLENRMHVARGNGVFHLGKTPYNFLAGQSKVFRSYAETHLDLPNSHQLVVEEFERTLQTFTEKFDQNDLAALELLTRQRDQFVVEGLRAQGMDEIVKEFDTFIHRFLSGVGGQRRDGDGGPTTLVNYLRAWSERYLTNYATDQNALYQGPRSNPRRRDRKGPRRVQDVPERHRPDN